MDFVLSIAVSNVLIDIKMGKSQQNPRCTFCRGCTIASVFLNAVYMGYWVSGNWHISSFGAAGSTILLLDVLFRYCAKRNTMESLIIVKRQWKNLYFSL